MNMPTLAAVAAALYLIVAMGVLSPRKAGYSQLRHTISELGEIGAPDQRLVAFGVFLPVGLALLLVAALVHARSPVAALALCITVGYLVAALFPCDAGSPLSGTTRQSIHNLGGGVEYIGGAFALMTLARDFGPLFQVAGAVVLVSAIALSIEAFAALRGIIQRVAELCLFGCLALAASRIAFH